MHTWVYNTGKHQNICQINGKNVQQLVQNKIFKFQIHYFMDKKILASVALELMFVFLIVGALSYSNERSPITFHYGLIQSFMSLSQASPE